MKILIAVLLVIVMFVTFAYAGLNIISVTLPTAMTLEQACRIYQEMWDDSTLQSVGNLNKGKLEFLAGDSFKYFEIIGKDVNGNDVLVANIETGVAQVIGEVTDCQATADLLKVSLRVFKLCNVSVACP